MGDADEKKFVVTTLFLPLLYQNAILKVEVKIEKGENRIVNEARAAEKLSKLLTRLVNEEE